MNRLAMVMKPAWFVPATPLLRAQTHLLLEFVHGLLGAFVACIPPCGNCQESRPMRRPHRTWSLIANHDPHIWTEALAVDDTFVVWCWLQVRFRVVVTMARHCGANRQSYSSTSMPAARSAGAGILFPVVASYPMALQFLTSTTPYSRVIQIIAGEFCARWVGSAQTIIGLKMTSFTPIIRAAR